MEGRSLAFQKKKKKKEGRRLTKDRISDLPDLIRTKILSFLPAEEVVSTCILSKRWKRVWASVPVLEFNNYGLTEQRNAKFLSFVEGVLDNRENLTLDTFNLTWYCSDSDLLPYGFEIISGVTLWMPRVLSIHINTYENFNFPGSIFTCASVEEMSLEIQSEEAGGDFIEAESIDLPRLKKLELRMVTIDDEFIRKLFSGCPALEELVFTCCSFEIDEISSPVLKKLTIENGCLFQGLEISCPSVMSLDFSSWGSLAIKLKNMASLLIVNFYWDQDDDDDDCDNFKILSGLSNVANLTLDTTSPDILDFLVADIQSCPTFNNLKSLELGDLDMNLHWNLVVCVLQHSPNLKTLILHFCQPRKKTAKGELMGNASFQVEYLETVKIVCPGRSAKFAKKVVRNLNAIVKSIGEVIYPLGRSPIK